MAFSTPNTKKHLTWGVLNAKIFGIDEQCNLKFGSIWIEIVNFYFLFFIPFSLSSLSPYKISSSLSLKNRSLPFSFSLNLSSFSSLTLIAPLFLSASPSQCLIVPPISLLQWFFFFFHKWVQQWEGSNGDGWVQMVGGSVGVGSNSDGWVWMGRSVVGGLGYGWVSLWFWWMNWQWVGGFSSSGRWLGGMLLLGGGFFFFFNRRLGIF